MCVQGQSYLQFIISELRHPTFMQSVSAWCHDMNEATVMTHARMWLVSCCGPVCRCSPSGEWSLEGPRVAVAPRPAYLQPAATGPPQSCTTWWHLRACMAGRWGTSIFLFFLILSVLPGPNGGQEIFRWVLTGRHGSAASAR